MGADDGSGASSFEAAAVAVFFMLLRLVTTISATITAMTTKPSVRPTAKPIVPSPDGPNVPPPVASEFWLS